MQNNGKMKLNWVTHDSIVNFSYTIMAIMVNDITKNTKTSRDTKWVAAKRQSGQKLARLCATRSRCVPARNNSVQKLNNGRTRATADKLG